MRPRFPQRTTLLAAGLLALGLMQMAGDVLHLPWLKGLGAASAASPAPKVFTAVQGYEPFSTRFRVEYVTRDGTTHRLPVTPEQGARMRGPYNRRNVYGAVLSYGPVLPASLREPVLQRALCGTAPLLHELGVDPASLAAPPRVHLTPRDGTPVSLPRLLEVHCP